MAERSGEQNREQNLDVFLNEDSDDDIETSPDIIGEEEYNVLFGSKDHESEFEIFLPQKIQF